MKNKILLALATTIAFATCLQAQISGTVYEIVDGNKQTLFGANIYWENSSVGTISDMNGNFKINKVNNTDKLIVSFIGYNTDTIVIPEKRKTIEVTLYAGEMLSEVTVSERQAGTRYSRMEIGNVQDISGQELCKAACCNLSESFETNASVDAGNTDAATGAKQIKLLGLAGKYVQFLTENIPNLYGLSQPYALGYIPGPWMTSMQISKGTSTVINGYDAVTGQINVEYKKPRQSDKFSLNLMGSSHGNVEGNIDAPIKVSEKVSTQIFAHAQNRFIRMDRNHDNFYDSPNITQYNFFNRWDYFGKHLTMRFGIKYIDETRKNGQIKEDSTHSELYKIKIHSQRGEAFFKCGYVFPEKDYQSIAVITNFVTQHQDSYYGHNNFDASQNSLYGNVLWKSAFGGNEKHSYTTGISMKYENLHQNLNDSIMNDLEAVPGVFFQYTGHFGNFNMIAGIRGDYHNQYGFLFTPRLNLKYSINEYLTLRASAGRSFRKANLLGENSFLLASSRRIVIYDNLDMEEAWNYGATFSANIPIKDRLMNINVEYYHTDFVKQIVADFETPKVVEFYNLQGKSFSNTYQIEVSCEVLHGWDITGAFRYNDVKQTIDDVLVESPLMSRFKGLLTTSYRTKLEKWQFDFTAQFNGPGRIPSTAANPEEFRRDDKFKAYNIFNAQITKFFKRWSIYVGVENIFNFTQKDPIIAVSDPFGDYFDSSLIWGPIDGRKFYLGIRFAIDKD
ncbi:MAG: TonB-dependent receptor [Bacteroidales bacterium]|nr:TonB-dependent receptor [Bacteroidales bacterium]